MKSIAISIDKVKQSMRMDGSYHNADINVYDDILQEHSSHCLDFYCSSIYTTGRGRRVYTRPDHGVPFLSNSDMTTQDPLMSCNYMSRKYGYDEPSLLKGGMILTGRVGAIGQTAFVPKYWEKHSMMGSDNIIRIVVNEQYKNGFIYAYLASKYGNLSFWKHATGGVQPFITDKMVAELPIPDMSVAFQQEVDDLIQESARLREEATDALDKAVSYFNQEYPIKDRTSVCYTKKLKSLGLGFAAYNNNIEVDDFIAQYDSHSLKITDITTSVFAPPLFKHIYLSQDNGYPFMTGSELTKFNMRYYRWLSPRGVKNIKDYVVKKGTLLLYKSGTTDGGILGNVFIADKKLDGCCLSDHVIRIVFNDDKMAYWAFAFLRSNGAIKMLQRLATGTMIPFITPERVSNMLIPAPDSNYEEIVELVSKYIDLNSKSKFLEIEAIEKVESEIESWTK